MCSTDPAAILDSLSPQALEDRLEQIRREGKAIRVLLRGIRIRGQIGRAHV